MWQDLFVDCLFSRHFPRGMISFLILCDQVGEEEKDDHATQPLDFSRCSLAGPYYMAYHFTMAWLSLGCFLACFWLLSLSLSLFSCHLSIQLILIMLMKSCLSVWIRVKVRGDKAEGKEGGVLFLHGTQVNSSYFFIDLYSSMFPLCLKTMWLMSK